MKTSLIIVAGGYSVRMGGKVRKPYLDIDGKPMLFYTLERFCEVPCIEQVVIVVNELDIQMVTEKWGSDLGSYRVTDVVTGGKRRRDSVYNGLKRLRPGCEIVLIHDCVRPFVSQDMILRIIQKAEEGGAAIVAVPVKDTIKEVDSDTHIVRTISRSNLWAAQTPQGFRRDIIVDSYNRLKEADFDATDDAQVAEMFGYRVEIVEGSYENIKITTPEDLRLAEAFHHCRQLFSHE